MLTEDNCTDLHRAARSVCPCQPCFCHLWSLSPFCHLFFKLEKNQSVFKIAPTEGMAIFIPSPVSTSGIRGIFPAGVGQVLSGSFRGVSSLIITKGGEDVEWEILNFLPFNSTFIPFLLLLPSLFTISEISHFSLAFCVPQFCLPNSWKHRHVKLMEKGDLISCCFVSSLISGTNCSKD